MATLTRSSIYILELYICYLFPAALGTEITGPIFIKEPKSKVEFLNTKGALVNCVAHGEPDPEITWHRQTGLEEIKLVEELPSLLDIHKNGSLSFFSFPGDRYRQEIHSTVYRCVASNIHGRIISHTVSVKATTEQQQQQLQAQVYDDYVIVGNTAVLTCHIPPFYKDDLDIISWIREDNLVIKFNEPRNEAEMTKNGQLLIPSISPKMNVELGFWCQIRNKLTGKTFLSQSAGRIKITEHQGGVPPTISHISETISIKVGQSAELNCAGQGYPPPIYKWISVSTGNIVSRMSRFKMENIAKSGTFAYTCKVENKFGIDENKVKVIVREPLEAYIYPNFQTVNSGQEINLECKISGHPIEEIIWRHNGRLIKRFNVDKRSNYKYNIKEANREHEGMYQCMLKNSWESVQTAAQIRLGDMVPTFIQTFKPRKLQPGPSISLKCSAIGRPSPNIRWKHNGNYIKTSSKFVLSEQQTSNGTTFSRVVVKSIRPIDGGEYGCIAKNKVNFVSHFKTISVYGPPIVHEFRNRTIATGENSTIKCYVSGYPITSISWVKDTKQFYQKSLKIRKNEVIISNVTKKDEGFYTCTAENGRGLKSEKKIYISVIKKPILSPLPLPPEILPAKNSYSTFCTVLSGDHPMTLTWLKNGKDASMLEKVDVTNTKTYSLLQIHEVNDKHSGNYTCVANNKAGKTAKSIFLKVASSPKWLVEPDDVQSDLNTNVFMHCKAEGYPIPHVKWFRQTYSDVKELLPNAGQGIIHFKNGTIKIDTSKLGMEGNYSCLAANGIEPDLMKFASLDIIDPLKISIEQSEYRRNATVIECKVYGGKNVKIQWRKSNKRLPITSKRFMTKMNSGLFTTSTLTVNKPKDGEIFKCSASTKEESVEKSILLKVKAIKYPENGIKKNKKKLQKELVKTTSNYASPTVKPTLHVQTKKMENIQRQGDESIETMYKPSEGKKSISKFGFDTEPESDVKLAGSVLNGTKTDLKTLLLFVIPAVAIFVLFILVVITLAAYFTTRRTNRRRTKETTKMEYSGIDSMKRSSINAENSKGTIRSMDQRYGKLEGPLPISDTNDQSDYQNAYEIPDYYAAVKPYSTLHFSTRNQPKTNSMLRCSQASV